MIEHSVKKKLMGSAFSLGICATNEDIALYWLEKGVQEIERIEALLSEYQPNSDTTKINIANHLEDILVEQETLELIKRSNNISQLTNGCFDITIGTLKQIYRFNNQDNPFPSDEEIKRTLSLVGYKKLQINEKKQTIQKSVSQMKISFNAIGKGYAADSVKKMWIENGIQSGYINASGDLYAFGNKIDGSPWTVAVSNPNQKNKPLFFLQLHNQAIATSGDYEQHFIYQGRRYSHNINPITGKPLQGIKSVSVISPSAELSDALATAVYVMGVKKGIAFVEQLRQTHTIIIDDKNKVYFSKNLKYEEINRN